MLRRPRTKTVPAAQRRLAALLTEIRACTVCAPHLEHGPRPVLRAHSAARILIVGQAPGIRVHRSGIPWDDPSGDRLRQWLDVDRDTFYDETRIAIVPSGFCYPGTSPRGGDYPPRPECAPRWMDRVVALLPHIQVTLLAGRYAQRIHLGARQQANLTETVRAWRDYWPDYVPLPHPSFRNNMWIRRNPWFEAEVLPALRERVHGLLDA
mgnify:CR=1 FL=1